MRISNSKKLESVQGQIDIGNETWTGETQKEKESSKLISWVLPTYNIHAWPVGQLRVIVS